MRTPTGKRGRPKGLGIWKHILIDRSDLCWIWTGGVNKKGYALWGSQSVARLLYEQLIRPVPEGMILVKHCDKLKYAHESNHACVNPWHTMPMQKSAARMKQAMNMRRSGEYHKRTLAYKRMLEYEEQRKQPMKTDFDAVKSRIDDILAEVGLKN